MVFSCVRLCWVKFQGVGAEAGNKEEGVGAMQHI